MNEDERAFRQKIEFHYKDHPYFSEICLIINDESIKTDDLAHELRCLVGSRDAKRQSSNAQDGKDIAKPANLDKMLNDLAFAIDAGEYNLNKSTVYDD